MKTFAHLLLGSSLLAACSSEGAGPTGAQLELHVAPLTLPGVDDVCYTLEVRNESGQTVWNQQHVCASQYGNAIGDITYIGTCDAQDPTVPTNGAANSVWLTIENVYTADVDHNDYTLNAIADSEWDNPCSFYADGSSVDGDFNAMTTPATNGDGHGPCKLTFDCLENQDVLVEFNITVMRDANQGFFDIAVEFEDIFCSAKFDCEDDADQDITLLHDPADPNGGRKTTVVLGFACAAGNGQTTWLHMDDLQVSCGTPATSYIVAPAHVPDGNAGPAAPVFFQTATYRGTEDFEDFDKCYWNMALGVNEGTAAANCTLITNATASGAAFPGDATPANTVYPYIHFEIALTDAAGQVKCGQYPLGQLDANGKVVTAYTTTTVPAQLDHHWQCGADTIVDDVLSCTGTQDGVGASFESSTAGVRAFIGASATRYYALPAGASLGDSCCTNSCCSDVAGGG